MRLQKEPSGKKNKFRTNNQIETNMKPIEYYSTPRVAYPDSPVKPYMTKTHTAAQAKEYAEKLEQYESEMPSYKSGKDAYYREEQLLLLEFKTDLFEKHGVTDNPKRENCYSIAWERGHSSGLGEVMNYFSDFVELIKD